MIWIGLMFGFFIGFFCAAALAVGKCSDLEMELSMLRKEKQVVDGELERAWAELEGRMR